MEKVCALIFAENLTKAMSTSRREKPIRLHWQRIGTIGKSNQSHFIQHGGESACH
jgi:hypothetical protein